MMSIQDFIQLLNNELGMAIAHQDLYVPFDELPTWDSVHLLWLLTVLDQSTGQTTSLSDLLEASNLRELYRLVVPT